MSSERLLTLRTPARAEELQGIRRQLEQALVGAGESEENARALVVAVNEACMNVIQHAYGERQQGDLVLEVEVDSEKFLFRLKDYAPRIDIKSLRPKKLSEVRPGGLGLPLINQIMDNVSYPEPPPGIGNILVMTKFRSTRQEPRDGT